jgi:iron(III) transport system permease protein
VAADVDAGVLARPVSLPARDRIRIRPDLAFGAAIVVLVGIFTVLPIGFVVAGSFDTGGTSGWHWGFGAWTEAFSNPRTLGAIGYSMLLAMRAPVGAIIGFVIAWLLVRVQIPARSAIEFALWVAFFLPALPVTIGWTLVLDGKYGLLNQALLAVPFIHRSLFDIHSVAGILWVHLTLTTVPIMAILIAPALRQLDGSLEASARVCGSRPFQTLWNIVLPALSAAFLTALVAGIIFGLQAFEIEQLLGIPAGIYVYSTRIYNLINVEPPLFNHAMALSTLFLVVLFVLACLYQAYTGARNYATISGRGVSFAALPAGRWRYLASALCLAYVAIGIGLPVVLLIVGSFMKLFGFFNIASPFTPGHWGSVLHDPTFLRSMQNSVVLGLGVALLGLVAYGLIGYVLVRTQLAGRRVLSLLIWLPWSVPGILLGVALLWLMLTLPVINLLYGTMGALILALIIQSMPIGTQMLRTAFGQVSLELEQASRVCGASWFRTYREIMLPLIAPMLVSIGILVFMGAIRDISTTVLLAGASTQPLSLLMLQFAISGQSESAAVVGIILAAIAVILALTVRRLGLRVDAAPVKA